MTLNTIKWKYTIVPRLILTSESLHFNYSSANKSLATSAFYPPWSILTTTAKIDYLRDQPSRNNRPLRFSWCRRAISSLKRIEMKIVTSAKSHSTSSAEISREGRNTGGEVGERGEGAWYVVLIVSDPVQTRTKRRRKKTRGMRRGTEERADVGAEGSKGAGGKRQEAAAGGREEAKRRGAYLTWHTGRVSRHILIEFFSRSGNAGISRRYYYIFRRYVASARDLSVVLSSAIYLPISASLCPSSLPPTLAFSPRRDNTLRDVFSLSPLLPTRRRGAYISGSLYLRHAVSS